VKYLRVKKWDEHQHYTDRDPPWIKVYNRLLDDYDFLSLAESAQSHLVKIWLLASRTDNRIPYDMAFIATKIGAKTAVDIEGMIVAGWLELADATTVPERPVKSRNVASRKKKDRDRKREARREQSASVSASVLPLETEERRDRDRGEKKILGAGAPQPPENWVARGVEIWRAKVGDTTHPRLGKALSGCVATHGAPSVLDALAEYADAPSNGRPKKLEWFAEDVVRWIGEAKEPLEQDGVLTAKGRRFMGVAS
jgi:hypothetical protein